MLSNEELMLEKLAGRLKWERAGDGIRVVIPARRNWRAALQVLRASWPSGFASNLLFTLFFLIVMYISSREPFRWWGILIFFVLLVAGDISRELLGKTILTLDSASLKIDWKIFGVKQTSSKFANERLHDLRFVVSAPSADIRNDFRLNEIQFIEYFATHSFAAGISEEEATALIARMMEVYKFPEEPVAAENPGVISNEGR
jgi:hypothetical protein